MVGPNAQDSAPNGTPAGATGRAALLATFYVHREKKEVTNRLQDLLCQGLNLIQDWSGRWRTPDGKEAFLLRFDAAHDATVLQLALNAPGDTAKVWETLRRRLESILEPEALDGIWGHTLTYHAKLNPGFGPQEAFEKLRPTARLLHSGKGPYASLAQAEVAGGWIWLLAVPIEGDGTVAGTVYVALSESEKERDLGRALIGEGAKLLMPELIAHKSYYQRRQYRGRRHGEYKRHLDEFREHVRKLLNELEQREIQNGEVSELTRRYHKLAEMVWWLEDLRVSMTRQLHNYDDWKITRDSDVLQYHRDYIENTNVELELLVSEGQYALGVADPVLSISRYRAEKAREEQQQRAREEEERRWRQQQERQRQREKDEQREQRRQEQEQARRRRKIDVLVAVAGAAIAVPELLNQQATAALLVWFPPAAWLLDRLFGIQKLSLNDDTHLRIILAAQLVVIAILAVIFYLVIHRLFGEPVESTSRRK